MPRCARQMGLLVLVTVLGCASTHAGSPTDSQLDDGEARGANPEFGSRVPVDAAWVDAGAGASMEGTELAAGARPVCGDLGPFDPVPLTPESIRCQVHADCVRREASCCPTCDPGNLIAISNAQPFWDCCPLTGCPMACEPYEPRRYARCIEGRCQLVDL